jgi:hypothetical protein
MHGENMELAGRLPAESASPFLLEGIRFFRQRFGMRFRSCAAACLLLGNICFSHGAGVTLITHGFNSDISDWVISMAGAVANYPALSLKNSPCYEIYFEKDSSGNYVTRERQLAGGDPTETESGEIIIKLDWSPLAGTLSGVDYSTADVAPFVANALMAGGFIPELGGHALAELPIHLIGHSRGGSLLCEVARLLGENGIWVEQLTTLDPHPLNNDYDDSILTSIVDAPAVLYSNVLFADNYYQMNNSFFGIDPSGQFVPGAYNRFLPTSSGGYGGFSPQHSNVHLWYHGTIDLSTPASDTAATITSSERQSWWTPAEAQGQLAGFYYSAIGGGDRLSTNKPAGGTNEARDGINQVWNFGAGINITSRHLLATNSGEWPDMITLNLSSSPPSASQIRQTNVVHAGDSFPVAFAYEGPAQSSNTTATFFLDADANPFNSNSFPIGSQVLSGGRFLNVNFANSDLSIPINTQSVGRFFVGASITKNGRTRYLYAPERLQIEPPIIPAAISITDHTPNSVLLTITGAEGRTVIIERSEDLLQWTSISTNVLGSAPTQLDEPLGPAPAHEFFRALTQE